MSLEKLKKYQIYDNLNIFCSQQNNNKKTYKENSKPIK